MSHTYKEKSSKEVKPSISLKIFCWFFRKEMIKLTDCEGKIRYSYLLAGCECGHLHCYPFWGTETGDCVLNDDGTVSKNSKSIWIDSWERVKR